MKKRPKLSTKCKCGSKMTQDEAEFWGECGKCREVPPKNGNAAGKDTGADKADREYHGGQGHRGEW